eukprot:CAMPEP_0204627290 /NCGR_PEP_ID=MMETSP0717-20131115/13393_1 /ASSEMBLY_ACC=CAM_ASM_000666 /TAXON_ID=230516 /ORGANISM="Chaetoceros curvisetus" /LENGTH=68 /DNA_ID=CAMNT_0051643481 /DNA_START=26 /DNA_END=232 /DNA_ORIENTATION=+
MAHVTNPNIEAIPVVASFTSPGKFGIPMVIALNTTNDQLAKYPFPVSSKGPVPNVMTHAPTKLKQKRK